jgi:hypothetical protein
MLTALADGPADSFVVAARVWALAAQEHTDYADVDRRARARRWDSRWDEALIEQARMGDERTLARETLIADGTLKGPRTGFNNEDVVRVGNQLVRKGLVRKSGPASGMQPRVWTLTNAR